MSRVVAVEYVSLDGVMEEPGVWSGPWFNDELGRYQYDQLFRSDALLLGRLTYEGFAATWPKMNEGEFGDRMNSLPKHVATTTKTELEWNATPIEGDVPAAVATLKDASGGDLLIYGSGQLLRTLMPHNLVDEYRLLTFPVILGQGKQLFGGITDPPALKLAEVKSFDSGALSLVYEPTG
jgi:dihydrofolate reductase